MKPIRPSLPPALFNRWKALAEQLGYGRRNARNKLLALWMDYTDAHPALFRRRP